VKKESIMQDQGSMSDNGSRPLFEAGKQVAHDAGHLGDSIGELAERAKDSLVELMEERPYLVLIGAAAAGYLIAGGLASRFTRLALGVGGRMLAQRAMGQIVSPETEPF
jgi:hypothetical protein